MIDITNPAALRARFAELGTQREAALVVSTPLREERDAIAASSAEQITALDAQIKDAETDLFALDQERALIARALGGRTGEG